MPKEFTTNALIGMSPTMLRQLRRAPDLHHVGSAQVQEIEFLLALHALQNIGTRTARSGIPMTDQERQKIAARMHRRLRHALNARQSANNDAIQEIAASLPKLNRRITHLQACEALLLAGACAAALTASYGLTLSTADILRGGYGLLVPASISAAFGATAASLLIAIQRPLAREKESRADKSADLSRLRKDIACTNMDSEALKRVERGELTTRAEVTAYIKERKKQAADRPTAGAKREVPDFVRTPAPL